MKPSLCRYFHPRSTPVSVRAAKPTIRTSFYPQCASSSEATWRKTNRSGIILVHATSVAFAATNGAAALQQLQPKY